MWRRHPRLRRRRVDYRLPTDGDRRAVVSAACRPDRLVGGTTAAGADTQSVETATAHGAAGTRSERRRTTVDHHLRPVTPGTGCPGLSTLSPPPVRDGSAVTTGAPNRWPASHADPLAASVEDGAERARQPNFNGYSLADGSARDSASRRSRSRVETRPADTGRVSLGTCSAPGRVSSCVGKPRRSRRGGCHRQDSRRVGDGERDTESEDQTHRQRDRCQCRSARLSPPDGTVLLPAPPLTARGRLTPGDGYRSNILAASRSSPRGRPRASGAITLSGITPSQTTKSRVSRTTATRCSCRHRTPRADHRSRSPC